MTMEPLTPTVGMEPPLVGFGAERIGPPPSEPLFPPKTLPAVDDWAVEAALARIGRMLASGTRPEDARPQSRIDPPHLLTQQPTSAGEPRMRRDAPRKPQKPGRAAATLAWAATMFGTTATACGTVLLVWSSVCFRPELWQMGLPIALVGAGLLLLGVFLQLDSLRTQDQGTSSRSPSRRPTTADSPSRPRYRRLSP